MHTGELFRGQVSRYDKERHFGFIETPDKQSYFFYRDKAEVIRLKRIGDDSTHHNFTTGDEVEFKVRPSNKENGRMEAYELRFIRNEQRDKLMDQAEQGLALEGYLKSIKEKLFVKHTGTYLLIPVDVSAWETNLEEVYNNRLDSVVTFHLTKTGKSGRLSAIVEGRKFSAVYDALTSLQASGESIPAIITGKNEDGYFVTVLEGVQGFIRLPKDMTDEARTAFFTYNQGEQVMVNVRAIHKNKKLSLEFTGNNIR